MKKLFTGMIWRLWWNKLHPVVLNIDKSVSIHYRNIKYLLAKISQVKIGISPPSKSDILSLSGNSSYNLRSGVTVNRWTIRTSKFGFETVSTIGAILWNDLPAELKNAMSLNAFNQKIKLWPANDFPGKISEKFIKNLGYM